VAIQGKPGARNNLDRLADELGRGVFWSDRAQKRATTMETWTYRAAMIAGGILLVPWIGQLLEIYGAYCRRVPMLIPCLSRRR
jgi:hypothetical protein